jgi:hypothetical protein
VVTGAIPLPEYFAPANLLKVLGARGMAKVLLSRLRGSRRADGAGPGTPGAPRRDRAVQRAR